jgi:hypothetical protein
VATVVKALKKHTSDVEKMFPKGPQIQRRAEHPDRDQEMYSTTPMTPEKVLPKRI